MRLNNEGKPTSKLWLVGGVIGAVALAVSAAMIAGGPRPAPAPDPTPTPAATPADANAANNAANAAGAENTAGKAASNAANAAQPAATATPKAGAAKPGAAKPAGGTTAVTGAAGGKVKMIEGMKVEDLKVGTGAEAKAGQNLSMDYRGTLQNGTVFDESYKRGQPFQFTLGVGQVIKGWDLGVVGMKVGGKRRLTIPGNLAYGENGTPDGSILPNATLIFEIELREVAGQ